MMRHLLLFALAVCFCLASCQPDNYIPKRRGYFHIDLPKQHVYIPFDKEGYPYSFEYPAYCNIWKDTNALQQDAENRYWMNIDFPTIGGRIYLSYKEIRPGQPLDKLLEDAHFMSFYHTKKADYENEFPFRNPNGVGGFLYEWGGAAASKYQFVATDSVKRFLRAALYFDATPNADSLKPLNDFIRVDIEHMLETLRWK